MKLNKNMRWSLVAGIALVAVFMGGCDNGMDAETMALLASKLEDGVNGVYPEDQTPSDVDDGDVAEESSGDSLVAVCHRSIDDPEQAYTIYVLPQDVDAFVDEGDLVGTCEEIAAQEEEAALVAVCHYSPRNPDRLSTIYIDDSLVDRYLDSGDTLGPCEELLEEPPVEDPPSDGAGGDTPANDLVAMCHFPPDDPFAMETIFVEAASVDAYLDAGDLLGSCEELWL